MYVQIYILYILRKESDQCGTIMQIGNRKNDGVTGKYVFVITMITI